MSGALVVVGSVVGLVLFVVLLIAFIRTVVRRATLGASTDPAVTGATVALPARMRSGRSASGHQLNGVGVLAVFPTEIRFILGVPRRTVTIRRVDIADVAVTKNLRLPGRWSAGGPPYLVVEWADSDGTHKTAFQTADADSLLAALT